MVTGLRILADRGWQGGLRPWVHNRFWHTIARTGPTWKIGASLTRTLGLFLPRKIGLMLLWLSAGMELKLRRWRASHISKGTWRGETGTWSGASLIWSQLVSPNSHLSLWQKTTKQPHAFVLIDLFHLLQIVRVALKLISCDRCGKMQY